MLEKLKFFFKFIDFDISNQSEKNNITPEQNKKLSQKVRSYLKGR
jgi:hypothetical protein